MATLALLGGPTTKTKPFPAWPVFDQQERAAVLEVLESRVWWRTPGTKTLGFEQAFAEYHRAKHGIAITNGTHALEVVLAAAGVSSGDEVIVPDYTFVATASSVLFTGAMPIMVDVDSETFCMDLEQVEHAITPRTKAIIAVHLGGHPVDMDRLTEIARKHDVMLIEDCAHAHGSRWRDQYVGTFGIAGTFSFQEGKLMTAGEGGVVITSDDQFERAARAVHDCGRMPGEWFYSHYVYGSNYRLSEWQGAVLGVQLTRLEDQTRRRHENANLLDKLFEDVEGITPQRLDPRCSRNGHYAYIFHYDSAAFGGVPTERFIEAMLAEGITNQAAYPPVHALDLFQNGEYRKRLCPEQAAEPHAFLKQPFPETDRAAWQTYWVPQTALLGDEEDMHEIVEAVKKIQEHAKELA